jgi:hypothetical protein
MWRARREREDVAALIRCSYFYILNNPVDTTVWLGRKWIQSKQSSIRARRAKEEQELVQD